MTQASEQKKCPDCGMPIPPWSPAGNCPACLFDDGKATKELQVKPPAETNERIGDWELQERIGEGAFGVVFAAEQTKPVRRAAALKILRPGMASKEILARFEAESQALALMNHPDVVTIYDAGVTDDGRPYIAMEMVPGVPVTDYAAKLSIPEKLELFDRVCAVVEHAHSRGIIHRDLKPANILVYEDESENVIVKLLDFGIAKATDHILTDATVLTREGHFLGTPEYMSPDQIIEVDIDIRADVYSLGIILFELLADRPPFVLDSGSLEAALKFLERVQDESAPIPSSVATHEFSSDLDWIVGKAIEKERARRYRSVGKLRDDLRRFKKNEPIEARPPGTFYITRKFLRRNWKLTATLAVISLSIIGAAAVSTVMAVKANAAASETKRAYSESDLRSAADAIDEGDLSRGLALLDRSLRTDPTNKHAAMLLRSTSEQYPASELIYQKALTDRIVPAAFIVGSEGNPVVITEIGDALFFTPDGSELSSVHIGGTNLAAAVNWDETFLAVANVQGDVILVDLAKRELLPLDTPEDSENFRVRDVKFSPESEHLALCYASGRILVWDTSNGEIRWDHMLESSPYSMAFFSAGTGIAVACIDGNRVDFDSATGEQVDKIPQQPEPVHSLVPSGSGYRYYTVSSTGIIAACDAGRAPSTFTEEQVDVPITLSAFDPVRRLTAYVSAQEVSVWTVLGNTIIRRLVLPDPPTAIALHPTENKMFIGTVESGIQLWDFDRRQLIGTQISRAKNVSAIQVDPETNILRCITRDGLLQHYQLPQSAEDPVNSQLLPGKWAAEPLENRNDFLVRAGGLELPTISNEPEADLRAIGASRDSDMVYGVYRDGFIRVWDARSGDLLHKIEALSESLRCADISPDGTLLLFRDKFGHVGKVNLVTGDRQLYGMRYRGDIGSITVSPSGKTFAISTDGGDIRVFDIGTGEPITELLSHDTRGEITPHYCRFSNDGAELLTWGGADRAFRRWDPITGTPISTPIVGNGIPRFAQYHEGDKYLTTVMERDDRTLVRRIWSLDSSIPVTPEKNTSVERFDFTQIQLPDDRPVSTEELNEIATANGITFGEHGLVEIPVERITE